jgi:hypothetical protein
MEMEGVPQGLPPCSRSAHDRNVLAGRAQSSQPLPRLGKESSLEIASVTVLSILP